MIVYFDTDDIDARSPGARARRHIRGSNRSPTSVVRPCTDTEGNDFSLFQRDDSVSA